MRIVDMNWRQVESYLRRDDRAILPIGSTEQHAGLSLATDIILAARVALEAADPLACRCFQAWSTASCRASGPIPARSR
jgi:creatinine amidohydrolase